MSQSVKNNKPKYDKLTQREHVLQRPTMWVGNCSLIDINDYVVINDDGVRIDKKCMKNSTGLLRIFLESLYNAVDNFFRSQSSTTPTTFIDVVVNKQDGFITVKNDGMIVPIEIHEKENIYNHTLIFSHLMTSSNYDDSVVRDNASGTFGLGIKLANIFSTKFTVSGVDPNNKKSFSQTWMENLTIEEKPIIKKSNASGYTEVCFYPDFKRFELSGFTDDIISLFARYVYDVAMITGCNVKFNGVPIEQKCLIDYSNLFRTNGDIVENGITQRLHIKIAGSEVVLVPNKPNTRELVPMSFVNGLYTINGGVHLDAWCEALFRPIVEKMNKPNSPQINIKDVKNFFSIFVVCSVNQPKFDSQSKSKLEEPTPKISLKKSIIQELLSWPIIKRIEQIITSKELTLLKKTERKKGFMIIDKLESANYEGTKYARDCTLILVEGDSAGTYAVSGLNVPIYGKSGRDWFGIYTLKGKLLNCKNAKVDVIAKNAVVQDIVNCLGLKYNVDYTKDENFNKLRYGRVMILTDADDDGFHISGLITNMFASLFPTLYEREQAFVIGMYTPIVRVFKGVGIPKDIVFYDVKEFDEFKLKHGNKIKCQYYKGLGTSTAKQVRETYGKKIVEYVFDDFASSAMDKAFLATEADARKEWIGNYTIERKSVEWEGDSFEIKPLHITDFVDNELIKFSRADCARSLPHIIDGLKDSQRKVMYTVFKRNITYTSQKLKVAQLGASVAEQTDYHHGEQNLFGAIVGMAQDYAGSNNIPLLVPDGSFGSRSKLGADSASERYIFTRMGMLTRLIFPAEDEPLLTHNVDDQNNPIEPITYVPIIPMILVNGSIGIGTGWSTNIPCYDPKKIIECIKIWLDPNAPEYYDEDLNPTGEKIYPDLIPHYNGGYIGAITPDGENKYISYGKLARVADQPNTFVITELPIGVGSFKYNKEFLDVLVEEKKLVAPANNQSSSNFARFTFVASDDFTVSINSMKLKKPINATNMVAFDTDGVIKKFDSPLKILEKFCSVRLSYYVKRKQFILESIRASLLKMKNRKRFMQSIMDETLSLYVKGGVKKIPKELEVLERELAEEKYDEIEGKYSYLLETQIRHMTHKNVEKLISDIEELELKYNNVLNTSEEEMWIRELDALLVGYDEYLATQKELQLNEINGGQPSESDEPKKKTRKPKKTIL
jgi:DNA topoisomerase-2